MSILKAHEAYEATIKRIEAMEEIEKFSLTDECHFIVTEIKDAIQGGRFTAVLEKGDFCWNYDTIYKCFTELGYEVHKNVFNDIVIKWGREDKA